MILLWRRLVRHDYVPQPKVSPALWLAGCVGAVEGPIADHIEDTFITFVIAGILLLLANVAFPNAARDPRAGQPRLGTATQEP